LPAVLPLLRNLPDTAPEAAAAFARLYPRRLAALPDLLPLAAMTNAVLEKNLPLTAMLDNRAVQESMVKAGALLEGRLDFIPAGARTDLLMRTGL
jgi:hypothetical protein